MRYLAVAALSALMLVPGAQAADLTTAEEVLAKYVDAIGGTDALAKVKTRTIKATFTLPAMGMEADYSLWVAPPNSRNVISLPAFGDVIRGVTGDVAYMVSPMDGASVLEGAEKAAMIRQNSFDEYSNWKENFESAEFVGKEDVKGKACYVVTLTAKGDKPATQYFDAESGLLTQVVSDQQGMKVTTTLSNYKEVDGIKMPHKIENTGGQLEFELVYTKVAHNEDIPESTFEIPAEVKPLLGSE